MGGKWTKRHDNRRRLTQAANLLDNATAHLIIIHESYPPGYEKHQELLQAFALSIDEIKLALLSYREKI